MNYLWQAGITARWRPGQLLPAAPAPAAATTAAATATTAVATARPAAAAATATAVTVVIAAARTAISTRTAAVVIRRCDEVRTARDAVNGDGLLCAVGLELHPDRTGRTRPVAIRAVPARRDPSIQRRLASGAGREDGSARRSEGVHLGSGTMAGVS